MRTPMPLARSHIGKEDELEAGGFDQPFLERAYDVVVAGGDGQSQLGHSASPTVLRRRRSIRAPAAVVELGPAHDLVEQDRHGGED